MINEPLIRRTTLFGAWCGVFYCGLLLVGWWVVAGFFPLHRPSAGPEEAAAFFRENPNSIRTGLVLVMWGGAVFLPFAAALTDYVRGVEGRDGPLTRIMQMSTYSNAFMTFLPPMFWLVAAYRADQRPAELTWLLNDLGWLWFLGAIAVVMPMFIAHAVAVLNDRREHPVFPRWMAWLSILIFCAFIPDQLMFFVKSGPFAWNGLFSFWIPLTLFCNWFLLVFWFVRRDVLRARAAGTAPVTELVITQ
jgi:hypothetical protein